MSEGLNRNDAQIARQIQDELRWDCRTEGYRIAAAVENGNVTLSASVPNYAVKAAAEEATLRIAGVKSLANNIEVRVPYLQFRADKEIEEAIAYLFEWNSLIPKERISAFIVNGHVTLIGDVPCWSHRQEAEHVVKSMPGVRGLTNSIRVTEAVADSELVCAAIKQALERQRAEQAQGIRLDYSDGALVLSGRAPNWAVHSAVLTTAGYAPGVRALIDEIVVAADA